MSSLRWQSDVDMWENKISEELKPEFILSCTHYSGFDFCKTNIFIEYFYSSTVKFNVLFQLNESENVAAAGLQTWKLSWNVSLILNSNN